MNPEYEKFIDKHKGLYYHEILELLEDKYLCGL